jgi:hypothetical protein
MDVFLAVLLASGLKESGGIDGFRRRGPTEWYGAGAFFVKLLSYLI